MPQINRITDKEELINEYKQLQIMEWIKVEDRLPTMQGHYLVATPHSFPKNYRGQICEFYEDNNTFYSESSDSPIEDATYWLPLMEPPK